jgi:molybdate transport system substrate-binding protein
MPADRLLPQFASLHGGHQLSMRAPSVIAVLALLTASAPADAAEITLLSGNGARAAVAALAAAFARATAHRVAIHFEVNAALKRRIEAGAPFDAVVLNPPVLDALIAGGLLDAGTRADIGRAGLGVGVRSGAPKPDIGSVGAFTRALLAAASVAYPAEGASGVYFVGLLDRLGIRTEMAPKLRPMPAEDAAEVVGRGEAELVVAVASRLAGVPGVDLVGPLPEELQTRIGFAAAVGSAAREPEAARALVRFLSAPSAATTLRALGVEPAGRPEPRATF